MVTEKWLKAGAGEAGTGVDGTLDTAVCVAIISTLIIFHHTSPWPLVNTVSEANLTLWLLITLYITC